ncbi:MAG: hypothetical protein HC893_05050 [Chloroflexaceae bacterium]|nr:hypothetical protein [Chloroflexaceae bacterium]
MVGVNGAAEWSDLKPLTNAERDTRDLTQVLEREECQFADVTLLLAEQATARDVRRAMIGKLNTARTDADLFLSVFSGCALPLRTDDGSSDLFLGTHDFDPQEARSDPTLCFSLTWLWKPSISALLHLSTGSCTTSGEGLGHLLCPPRPQVHQPLGVQLAGEAEGVGGLCRRHPEGGVGQWGTGRARVFYSDTSTPIQSVMVDPIDSSTTRNQYQTNVAQHTVSLNTHSH